MWPPLPAASWFLPAAFYETGVTDRFYDSHEELLEHTLAIQRELIAMAGLGLPRAPR